LNVIHLHDANISCRLKLADRILIPVVARSVLFFSFLSAVAIAAPAIGIVTASGHFSVEGSQVWGNATLFEGATVETSSASSILHCETVCIPTGWIRARESGRTVWCWKRHRAIGCARHRLK
jgi:hypothetical protein